MIYLDQHSSTPLYVQLYKQLRQKILTRELGDHQMLPGMRTLAKDLGVSLNTVKNAYYQLEAEGFVQARPGIGFAIQSGMHKLAIPTPTVPPSSLQQAPPPVDRTPEARYDFQYGGLPYAYFPRRKWLSYFRQVTDDTLADGIDDYPHFQGTLPLRHALCQYLKTHRGVRCSPEQIVIGSGIHHMLEALCRILPTREIYFEEPGYNGSRRVFANNGFTIHPIPASFDSLDFSPLEDNDFSLAYVTPSHQFPYGSVLPIQKRMHLLQLAHDKNAYLIEDDYDSEYRYNSLPIPSLYSIDRTQRVIYTGTFSKSLLPSLRMSYLVLPPPLLQRYQDYFQEYQCTVSGTDQGILARILEDGEYEKHQRRLCNIYRKKHDLLVSTIERQWPEVKVHGKNAGLHLILEFPPGTHGQRLIDKAEEKGISLYSTAPYWQDKTKVPPNVLFLGYSTLSPEEISQALKILHRIW